jgi:hypothetical protein
MALGLAVMLLSAAGLARDYTAERTRQAQAEQDREQQRARSAEKAEKKAKFLQELPAKIAGWRATMTSIEKGVEAPELDPKLAGSLMAMKGNVLVADKELDGATPPELSQFLTEATSIAAKVNERAKAEQALASIPKTLEEASADVTAQAWIAADDRYQDAMSAVEELDKVQDWLRPVIVGRIDTNGKKLEIQRFRNGISGVVKVARLEDDHQKRLAQIERINGSLRSNNRASYEKGKAELATLLEACGRCKTANALRTAISKIEVDLAKWPIDLGTIQEMKNRYADLKGRRIRVKGRLAVSTYYNCRFGSHGEWRSLELTDAGFSSVHAYCSRGDTGCESIFNRLASGDGESGTAILEYPTGNYICEEDQTYLVGWSP